MWQRRRRNRQLRSAQLPVQAARARGASHINAAPPRSNGRDSVEAQGQRRENTSGGATAGAAAAAAAAAAATARAAASAPRRAVSRASAARPCSLPQAAAACFSAAAR